MCNRRGERLKFAVGKITGWVPAQGDDVALWHVVHEDGDEEDLEEHEVRDEIMDEKEWLTHECPHGWLERNLCRRFGTKIVMGTVVDIHENWFLFEGFNQIQRLIAELFTGN